MNQLGASRCVRRCQGVQVAEELLAVPRPHLQGQEAQGQLDDSLRRRCWPRARHAAVRVSKKSPQPRLRRADGVSNGPRREVSGIESAVEGERANEKARVEGREVDEESEEETNAEADEKADELAHLAGLALEFVHDVVEFVVEFLFAIEYAL
jgi:hypothetical protein